MSKRVRTVFGSHSQLAHVWAQQTHDHGRSGDGRMFFEGAKLYSYGHHYTIAMFTDATLNGERVVLFNGDGYSVSTGKHKSEARRALQGLSVRKFHVPSVDTTATAHAVNVRAFVSALEDTARAFANPRKRAWLSYDHDATVDERCAALRVQEIADYCAAFALPMPAVDLEAMRAAIREAFVKHNDPKIVAKRAKDAAKRNAKRAVELAGVLARFHAYGEGVWPRQLSYDEQKTLRRSGLCTSTVAWDAYRIRERADYERTSRAWQQEARHVTPEQWQAGEGTATSMTYGRWDVRINSTNTLCRRKGERLETSRGAEVPWQHALVVFFKAQRCRRLGKSWHRNGEQVAVGHFQLDAIDEQGNIRAGCHTIGFDEMLRLAVREIPNAVQTTFPLPALVVA